MATPKKIAVSKDARATVHAVRNYDPTAPSATDMKQASGVDVAVAQTYTDKLSDFGYAYGKAFEEYLRLLKKDLDSSVAAIEDLQGLDAEVAQTLKGLEGEVTGDKNTKGRRR